LVFFLLETIPGFDLSAFYAYYEAETRGAPPFSVPMMCTLLIYSYAVGVFSSRKIAAACERNLAFLAIVGSEAPDFRTISDFRKIHWSAFEDLFLEVLRLAHSMGMIKLGNLALDGSKFKANASRHKAMSYEYMTKEVSRLRSEIEELTRRAQQTDAAEDAVHGARRGDELPEELRRREDRLAVIEAAMKRLEVEKKEKAEAEQRRRDEAQAEREAAGKRRCGRPAKPVDPTPEDKAQTNFTDPEAKVMKTSNKGFDYGYNAQAVVDEAHQIIVSADVTRQANDKQQAGHMAEQTRQTLTAAGIALPPVAPPASEETCRVTEPTVPSTATTQSEGKATAIPMSMDNGYFSEEAVAKVTAQGFDPHIAVGRQKHHTPQPTEVEGPPPENATVKEKMAHKLRTGKGRACYAKRKQIVEPVFGQIKQGRGFRQFLVRGIRKVRGEWKLVCLTHNLLKIWRHHCALT
jgi:transposase